MMPLGRRQESLFCRHNVSREPGQLGSLGVPPSGCLANGTWRANPGLAPMIGDTGFRIRVYALTSTQISAETLDSS